MTVLAGVLAWADSLVQSAGALGLTGVMAAEAVLPIPSAVVLPVVGARVASGELALVGVLLATTAGSVLGSGLLYGLARWGSRRVLGRLTSLVGVPDQRWARIEDRFARHGALAVLLGRVVPGVRCVVPLPAGVARIPLGRFLVATAIGSALWNGAWILAGAWLTVHWNAVTGAAGAVASAGQPAVQAVAAAGLALVLVSRTRVRTVLAARG